MRTESYEEGQPMNRAKIMVVDDDPDLRQALSLRLRANNFDTVNACDGYSAIAMAQKNVPSKRARSLSSRSRLITRSCWE